MLGVRVTELTVELLAWIRAERRFDGIDELVTQLKRDVATARALVGARAERLALR